VLTKEQIREIEDRCNAATKGPWESFIEGRDHLGGDSMIRTGGMDSDSPDLYIYDGTDADLDFIAHARQDIPLLIAEIRRLQTIIDNASQVRT